MEDKYLELFTDISFRIEKALKGMVGTHKAKEKIKRGAFGDITVYIDKIAEDIIINSIKKSGFQCSVLSEEIGLVEIGKKLPIIIVDPIDGSLNAKRGIPYFSFSIALSEGVMSEDISIGYVKNLSNKDSFYAIKGKGSFFNDTAIRTDSENLNIIAVEGFKKESDKKLITFVYGKFNKVRQVGSMALDICYLATGAFDMFLNVTPSRIIDYAAAKIILEEAQGGLYKWPEGAPFKSDVSQKKGGLFFGLSNRKLLDRFLTMVEDMQ